MNTGYEMMTVLPFSLLTMILFRSKISLPEGNILGYILCAVFTLWLSTLRQMRRRDRLCSIGTVAVFLCGMLFAEGEEYRQYLRTDYFWVVWVCGISAAALLLGIWMNKHLWCKRMVSAVPPVFCIALTFLDRAIPKAAFAPVCFLLLVRTAEEVQHKWKKSGSTDMKGHITRIAPFFLAVSLLVYAIPAPDSPYGWQFAKNAYHQVSTFAIRLYGRFTHTSDDYAGTGFSESSAFSGLLNDSDEQVLQIQADNRNITDLKLVGCISSDFTGREWRFHTANQQHLRMLDTIETTAAVRKFAPDSRSDYYQKVNLEYENYFFNTQYVFSPTKIKLAETRAENSGITEKNGSIFSEERLGYLDHYKVSCYVLNSSHPRLKPLLESAAPLTETEWKETVYAESAGSSPDCTYENYQEYRREIYRHTGSIANISDRTAGLLSKLRQNTSSRYDTMKALESYLRGLEYSTDCGALPDSVTDAGSFLDYFLFTAKKGYCMHFATAFVLLGNAMDIPCRYVRGYRVHQDGQGTFNVKQNCAHAWAEVYFDNVGWVAFDPTPGDSDQDGWEVRGNSGSYIQEQTPQSGSEPPVTAIPIEAEDAAQETEQKSSRISWLVLLIPSVAILCFLVVFFGISRILSRIKYSKMSHEEKFRYLTQQNLRLIGYLGYPMEEHETLAEYSVRLMNTDSADLKAQLGFLPVYEALLYSDHTITGTEIQSAETNYDTLRTLVKHSRLRFRLLFLFSKQSSP